MSDPRHQKLASVLVNYSLRIKPGDRFLIVATPLATPLLREVYREALRVGAHITTQIEIEALPEILLREGSDTQLTYISDIARAENEKIDAYLNVLSDANTKARSGIDPARIALRRQARGTLLKRFMERSAAGELRWCITLFPTDAYAQDAGMSLSDYEDFVYGAGLLDKPDPIAEWGKVQVDQQHVLDFLNQHDEIHIVTPDTDITYRVGGRTWISAYGDANFPDGEVFTGPIEDTVNGHVRFSYPAIYDGNEVEDVRLTFRDGKVVDAKATHGLEYLVSMLNMDAGARYLGEVAFGLNYGITRFTRNILFDEKIGGTMHMALGASYPETGGKNNSALHWDMICDLRQGKVYADGQLCYEAGKFTI